jgi:GNAT superfamily N-acetyltransferase
MVFAAHDPLIIRRAQQPADFVVAASLFQAYADGVGQPECFEDLEAELRQLSLRYSRPSGELFLAFHEGIPAGCCAFRSRPDTDHTNACELRRLYVCAPFRRLGLGHLLVATVMDAARVSGYSCMLLDTLTEMEAARALYEEIGFVEIPPFDLTPLPGAHHLKAVL